MKCFISLRIPQMPRRYGLGDALIRLQLTSGDKVDNSREKNFKELYSESIPKWLSDKCEELSFEVPTFVQKLALPDIFEGKDVILQAHTGSGKTLAYTLPILSKIDPNRAAVQAVVVVPTRELGLQVAGVMKQLARGSPDKILIMSVMEGSKNRRQQLWATAEPPHIVVGNPRSLQKLVNNGRLRLAAVNFVVLDEVDACLISPETRAELHTLLSRHLSSSYERAIGDEEQASLNMELNSVFQDRLAKRRRDPDEAGYRSSRQTILCSATIPQRQHFAMQCFKQGWTETLPTVLHPHGSTSLVPAQLCHEYIKATEESRAALAVYLLCKERKRVIEAAEAKIAVSVRESEGKDESENTKVQTKRFQAIVFIDDPTCAREVQIRIKCAQADGSLGGVLVLDGEAGLTSRANVMEEFRAQNGTVEVLIASDLAARGLDIPGVSNVLLLEVPATSAEYIHKAGRAGRLGREGTVTTIIREGQEFVLQRYSNEIGTPIHKRHVAIGKRT